MLAFSLNLGYLAERGGAGGAIQSGNWFAFARRKDAGL
jgi:hypothetical protein